MLSPCTKLYSTALSFPYCQVFRHSVCLQSGWLRIIWKWERGLVVGQIWGLRLIKTDPTVTDQDWSDCERPKTDNGSMRTEGKLKRAEIFSISLLKAININFDQTRLVRMCCMRFCLLVQFVHLRPWELQIWGGTGAHWCTIGCIPPEKSSFELPLRATGHAIIFAIISTYVHQRTFSFWKRARIATCSWKETVF